MQQERPFGRRLSFGQSWLMNVTMVLPLAAAACASVSTDEGFVEGEDGTPIHYLVMGSGEDTVVVVHGGPGAGMNAVLPHLSRWPSPSC